MLNRRKLKSAHEDAVLQHFQSYLRNNGFALQILTRPEPPEAIIDIDGRETWIEITDAFLNKAHAISLTSGACDDVKHVVDGNRLVVEPDETFSNVLHSVIEAKYDKGSMRTIAKIRGPGILLVGIFTPFTTAKEVAQDEAVAVAQLATSKPIKVFETIYVYDGTGQRTFHALYHEA
jgi:hypothetical protein